MVHDVGSDMHKFISLMTGSYWSHTCLYLGDDIIIESTRDGVGLKKCSEELKKCDFTILRYPFLTNVDKDRLIKESLKYLGYDYDFGSMIYKFKHKFSQRVKYQGKQKKQINCGTLVAEIYRDIKLDLLYGICNPIPKDFLTSKHLMKIY